MRQASCGDGSTHAARKNCHLGKAGLFRPRRARRPLVAAHQGIQHPIHDRSAIVAVGHDHRALPARGAGHERAAKTRIVAALHGDGTAHRASERDAKTITEIVDAGQISARPRSANSVPLSPPAALAIAAINCAISEGVDHSPAAANSG